MKNRLTITMLALATLASHGSLITEAYADNSPTLSEMAPESFSDFTYAEQAVKSVEADAPYSWVLAPDALMEDSEAESLAFYPGGPIPRRTLMASAPARAIIEPSRLTNISIPEPPTIAMTALAGLCFMRKRRE